MVRDMSESLSTRGRLFNTSRANPLAEGAGVSTRSGTPPKPHARLQFTTFDGTDTPFKHLGQSVTRKQLSTTSMRRGKENIGAVTDVGSPGAALLKNVSAISIAVLSAENRCPKSFEANLLNGANSRRSCSGSLPMA